MKIYRELTQVNGNKDDADEDSSLGVIETPEDITV